MFRWCREEEEEKQGYVIGQKASSLILHSNAQISIVAD